MTDPADPIDVVDELAAIAGLVECAAAACQTYAASAVAVTLGVAGDRLAALKADFEALRKVEALDGQS